jgi:hypothetical protein
MKVGELVVKWVLMVINSMRRTPKRLFTQDSLLSSLSTDSDPSPSKPGPSPQLRRASSLTVEELSNARIIQSRLVYVINLPETAASEEALRSKDLFGQYGCIVKCVVNHNSQHSAYQAHLTFETDQEAAICIKACNKFVLDGNELGLTFGTTKYCNYFLRGNACPKNECLYLHEFAQQNNVLSREAIPHTKHIQPTGTVFDGLKVIVTPPVGRNRLPQAKIIRDRALSEQMPESTANQQTKSKFSFAMEGEETEVPGCVRILRKLSTPKDDIAEIPLLLYNDIFREMFEDKWMTDVLEFQLEQEKVLVFSRT